MKRAEALASVFIFGVSSRGLSLSLRCPCLAVQMSAFKRNCTSTQARTHAFIFSPFFLIQSAPVYLLFLPPQFLFFCPITSLSVNAKCVIPSPLFHPFHQTQVVAQLFLSLLFLLSCFLSVDSSMATLTLEIHTAFRYLLLPMLFFTL